MPLNLKPYLIAVALLISFLAGFTVQGYRKDNQILDMRLEASETALQSAIKARAKTKAIQDKITALDAQKTKELNRAKYEINRIRDSVRNGTGWLSLNANCTKLPGLTLDTGLGDGTAPRLTDAAESNYYLLIERANLCTKQVEVLQGAIQVIYTESNK